MLTSHIYNMSEMTMIATVQPIQKVHLREIYRPMCIYRVAPKQTEVDFFRTLLSSTVIVLHLAG